MKFTLIAAFVLLALAQGSFAQETDDFERFSQYFADLKEKVTELISNQELTGQVQTFLENKKTELEPLATQIQDQLKSVATNVDDQIRPLAVNVQAQIQPMVDNLQKQMEAILQKLAEQTKAISN